MRPKHGALRYGVPAGLSASDSAAAAITFSTSLGESGMVHVESEHDAPGFEEKRGAFCRRYVSTPSFDLNVLPLPGSDSRFQISVVERRYPEMCARTQAFASSGPPAAASCEKSSC